MIDVLSDLPVGRMTLPGRAQLDEVRDFPQVPREQDPNAGREGHGVCRFVDQSGLSQLGISRRRTRHQCLIRLCIPKRLEVRRHFVPQGGSQGLGGLCRHPVPLNIPVRPVVHGHLDRAGDPFQCPPGGIVFAPSAEIRIDDALLVPLGHGFNTR